MQLKNLKIVFAISSLGELTFVYKEEGTQCSKYLMAGYWWKKKILGTSKKCSTIYVQAKLKREKINEKMYKQR